MKITLVDVAALGLAAALGVGAWMFNPADDSGVPRQRSTTTTEADPAAETTAAGSTDTTVAAGDPDATTTTTAPGAAPDGGTPAPAGPVTTDLS